MTIRKVLIFEDADECGHRHGGRCEHPSCPDSDGVCPSTIALWCPLPNAPLKRIAGRNVGSVEKINMIEESRAGKQ